MNKNDLLHVYNTEKDYFFGYTTFSKLEDTKVLHKKSVKEIDEIIKGNLYNSIAQAIIKIFLTSHLIHRVFLIVCVSLTSSVAAVLVIQSFVDYFKYNVYTTTRTIFELPSLFPKITICNNNPFTTKYAFEFLKNTNSDYLPEINMFDKNQTEVLTSDEKFKRFWRIYLLATQKMVSSKVSIEEKKMLGQSLDDILFSCDYNNVKCNSSDFIWKFDRLYGNCYVFNSGYNSSDHQIKLKKSFIAGAMNGFKVTFYVNYHEDLNEFNSLFGFGALVRIENGSFANDDTNYDEIFLSPGYLTSISITDRVFKFNLPKPYSNCDIDNEKPINFDNSEYFNLISQSSYEYTQQLCFYQCYQKYLIESCNCTDPWFVSLLGVEPCETNNETTCLLSIYNDKYLNGDFLKEKCLSKCPLQCKRKEFKYTTSTLAIDNWLFYEKIKANKNLMLDFYKKTKPTRESLVTVNVFYNSLTYTISTESIKMDLISLLAYVGGILSLFLGVSVFSIFELIEIIIEIYIFRK